MLAAGADIEARDKFGETPVSSLGGQENLPNSSHRRAAGRWIANLGARDEGSRTPLHWALGSGFQAPDSRLPRSWTPVLTPFRQRDLEWPNDLVHWCRCRIRGEPSPLSYCPATLPSADPKLRNADGKTPWDLAPKDSHAYWLIWVTTKDGGTERGATPLHYSSRWKVFTLLGTPPLSPCCVAADAGHRGIGREDGLETPLHWAARVNGNLAMIITEMLDAGRGHRGAGRAISATPSALFGCVESILHAIGTRPLSPSLLDARRWISRHETGGAERPCIERGRAVQQEPRESSPRYWTPARQTSKARNDKRHDALPPTTSKDNEALKCVPMRYWEGLNDAPVLILVMDSPSNTPQDSPGGWPVFQVPETLTGPPCGS